MNKSAIVLAALALAFAAGSAHAAKSPAPPAQTRCAALRPTVNAIVSHWMLHGKAVAHRATGAVAGLYLDGRICYFGYGTTRLHGGHGPTRHTLFKIASVTKTFTATMLALSEIRHPDFNVHGPVDTSLIPCAKGICLKLTHGMQKLTYFELATFTGGLPDSPSNLRHIGQRDYNQADFIAFLNARSAPQGGLPASNVYSNSGYGFLGELAMALDGYHDFNNRDHFRAGFDRWIAAGITQPLGMTCTVAIAAALPPACNAEQDMATGYAWERGRYVPVSEDSPPWGPQMGPAGGLRSNVQDLMHYLAAYLGARKVAGNPVPEDLTRAMALARKPTAVTTPHGPPSRRQAYAWIVDDAAQPAHAVVNKNGGLRGFHSCVAMMPAHRIGIVLLTTGDHIPICKMSARMLREIASGANP